MLKSHIGQGADVAKTKPLMQSHRRRIGGITDDRDHLTPPRHAATPPRA